MHSINELEEYYNKYIKEQMEGIEYIHRGAIGEGIYNTNNKTALIKENNKIVFYKIINNLAYEKNSFNYSDMYKSICFFINYKEE